VGWISPAAGIDVLLYASHEYSGTLGLGFSSQLLISQDSDMVLIRRSSRSGLSGGRQAGWRADLKVINPPLRST